MESIARICIICIEISDKMCELSSLHKNANMSKDASKQVVESDYISQNVKYIRESLHKKKC